MLESLTKIEITEGSEAVPNQTPSSTLDRQGIIGEARGSNTNLFQFIVRDTAVGDNVNCLGVQPKSQTDLSMVDDITDECTPADIGESSSSIGDQTLDDFR